MAILSDSIEQFIKSLMDDYDEIIEIQRNELADYFSWRAFANQLCFGHAGFLPKRDI